MTTLQCAVRKQDEQNTRRCKKWQMRHLKKSYSEPIFNVWYHLGIKESATVSLPSNHEPLNRKLPRLGQQIEQIHF